MLWRWLVLSVATRAMRADGAEDTRFVLLSRQRSGTHFVRTLLSQCPGVLMADEIMLAKADNSMRCLFRDAPDADHAYGAGKLGVMDRFWGLAPFDDPRAQPGTAAFTEQNACVRQGFRKENKEMMFATRAEADQAVGAAHALGFLWHIDQGWWPIGEWLQPLRQRGVRVLMLIRSNLIAHAIASANTNVVNVNGTAGGRLTSRWIKARMRMYGEDLTRMRGAAEQLRAHNVPVLPITYETLLERPEDELVRMLHFIGADPAPRKLGEGAVRCGSANVSISFATKHHTRTPWEYLLERPLRQELTMMVEECKRLHPACRACMFDDSCTSGVSTFD